MAERRKRNDENSGYDIQIGFIHEFTVHDSRYSERMNGHPKEGRVYRIIKDPQGYRLHIGRENNDAQMDGIYLGYELEGEQKAFQYKIEIITKENYLSLPIQAEDTELIVSWISEDNQDLWEGIRGEQSGHIPVIRTQEDLLSLLKKAREARRRDEENLTVVNRNFIPLEVREHALEASLNLITCFKKKPTEELLALFDGIYNRIITITRD